MANTQQKSQSPTDAPTINAVNAVEDTLGNRSPNSLSAIEHDKNSPASTNKNASLNDSPSQTAWATAANDDRAAIGHILQIVRQRPSLRPLVLSSIATLGWVVFVAAAAYFYKDQLQALLSVPRLVIATAVIGSAVTLVPIVFFYALGHMFRRAQDMRLIAESMVEVAMRFGQPETTAREAIITVGQAIRREVAAMGDGVERALARAAELEALVHNEVSALERAYNDNEIRIRDLLSELSNERDTLIHQAEHVRNAIASVHLDLSHDITSVGDLVSDRVNEVAQRVTRALTEQGEHITLALGHAGDSMIDTLSERGSTLLDRLETTSDRATSAIASASERLTESLKFKTENVHDEFADLAARLQHMMATRLDQVAQSFAEKSSGILEETADRSHLLTNSFNETTAQIADSILARANEVDAMLRSTGDSLVQDLDLRGKDVISRLTSHRDNVNEMLNTSLNAFEEVFNHRGTELAEKISRDAGILGGLITRHVTEFDHTVKTYGGELVERLGNRTQDVSDAMRSYIDSFDARVTGRTEELNNSLDQRLQRFEGILIGRTQTVTSEIENRIHSAADAVHTRMEQLSHAIKTHTAEADLSLAQIAKSASDTILSGVSEAEQTLRRMSDNVAHDFVEKANKITTAVVERTQALETILSDKSDGILAALTAKNEQFAERIGKASEQAIALIDNKGFAFTNSMLENTTEISRLISTAGEHAAKSVARTFSDLHDPTNKLISKARDAASSAVNEMMETHNILRTDGVSVFERLREANIMLQEVLTGAQNSISTLENTLMLRVSEFVTAMNQVNTSTGEAANRMELNIDHFRETTGRVLHDLGQIAGQFDIHGRQLWKTAELIEQSNRNTDELVDRRRAQLESLLSAVDTHTEGFEQKLNHLSKALDESLGAASSRAGDVARDTQNLFGDTNERFAATAREMKQMAVEMQRELEATRTELRRGVFELPQEASESVAQMRRVVIDQIEALAELNRIVVRHSRNVDLLEPTRRAREERSESAARTETSAQPRTGDTGGFVSSSRRPEPDSASVNGQATPSSAGRSWLIDLLNRASRDEPERTREFQRESREPRSSDERPPRHSIESLDSLSVDIARMIDHNAAADLWDRYKRGERNVFTRRLYTLQGQQAFDEIRKKYRADREFKLTVDRYIEEFERLFEEVSRDDRGQVMAHTYLTSETGKVYTMLAHAAGRFD
jgi:hypothetical protein